MRPVFEAYFHKLDVWIFGEPDSRVLGYTSFRVADGSGTQVSESSGTQVPETRIAESVNDRLGSWTTLLVGIGIALFLFVRNQQYAGFEEYYLLNTALLLGLPLMVILLILRRDIADWGMRSGNLHGGMRLVMICYLLFLPILLVCAPQPSFQNYYLNVLLSRSGAVTNFFFTPNGLQGGALHYDRLLFHETVLCFYMFAWEWFFRGFLLFGLRRIMPVWAAILIQAALFMLLHWSKPPIEVASSFFGGIFLAFIALRCRSFLPCFALHFLISATFDLAVIYAHFHR